VLGCRVARTLARPRVLIGGLGMGFTLRAALDILPPAARILVAELIPAVIEWNRGPLGALAQHPLDDPRVTIEEGDVAAIIRSSAGRSSAGQSSAGRSPGSSNPGRFDAVLLDVDNGPIAMTAASNAGLYNRPGLAAARAALTPGGVLAIWSASEDRRFEQRLRDAGFSVQLERVRSRLTKGPRHTIILAQGILAQGVGHAGDPPER
jgi:spermidine synthase